MALLLWPKHKAELESFGSLGWSLILAYLPILVRPWRDPSMENRHPGVKSAWQEGETGQMDHRGRRGRAQTTLATALLFPWTAR